MTTIRRNAEIEVPLALLQPALAAVIPAASGNVALPVLLAVHITVADGVLTVEATDSYRLHQVKAPYPTADRVEFDILLDAAWLKSIRWPKPDRHPKKPTIVAIERTSRTTVTIMCDKWSWSGPVITDKYPDTAAIIAEDVPDEGVSAFNPKYLADALKVADRWSSGTYTPVEVHSLNPTRPCRFRALRDGDGLGAPGASLTIVLMPVRTREPLRKAS